MHQCLCSSLQYLYLSPRLIVAACHCHFAPQPYTPPASYTSAVDFSATSDSSRPAFVARAHYPASGHAAGRGFSESAWVSNEVLVANERCFGMLWHILHSFALFTRIDDILS